MKSLLKTTLSLVGFLCLSQLALGQTVGQGAWMLGGSASFTSTKVKDVDGSTTRVNINPNVGYFIADDLAIGLGVNVTSVESNTDFGVGPYVRFYFANSIFAQAGVDFGLGDNEFTNFDVGIGYSWFINNGVAIEPKVFYRSENIPGPFDRSVIGLSIGIQAFAHHDHGMPR